MAEEEVGIRLALKNRREVQHGINEVGDEFDRVGDEAQQAGRKARIGAAGMVAFGKSGRLAGRAVVYGFGAASAAVVGAGIALTKFSKDSIGEAREAQKVGAVTAQIIKSTGGIANISARQVGDLAGAISVKAGIDDEAIQSGSNLLLTFKNVRNETGRGAKIFDRATRSAVDLSAAGFGSIESGSKMLGKALNDPLKGITALSRAGVTFTEGQKKQIERFVEQNDLLSAQKMVLAEVESQVGGVAAKQATWGEKAAVSWGNIQESFGTALLPMLDRTQRWFVQEGAPALENYVSIFERRGIPKIQEFAGVIERRALPVLGDLVDEGRPLVREILPAAGSFLSTAADAFGVIAPKAKAVFQAFNDLPDWAKASIAVGAGGAVVAKKLNAGSLLSRGGALGGIASMAKPLPVYVVNGGPGANVPGRPGSTTVVPAGTEKPTKARSRVRTNLGRGARAATIAGLLALNETDAIPSVGKHGDALIGGAIQGSYLGLLSGNPFVTAAGATLGGANGVRGVMDASRERRQAEMNHRYRAETIDWLKSGGKPAPVTYSANPMTGQFQFQLNVTGAPKTKRELAGFNKDITASADAADRLDKKRVAPSFSTPGLQESQRATDYFQWTLGNTGRMRVTPSVQLDGIGTAEARLDSFSSKLTQLNNSGIGLPAPARPRVEQPTFDDDFFDVGEDRRRDRRPVQLVLRDGRVLADVTEDGFSDKQARQ